VFEFKDIVQSISEKLVRRHPHVFGNTTVEGIDVVYEQWERIKKDEKSGTKMERHSALDGNPVNMPALMRAQKVFKKALKAGLLEESEIPDKSISEQEVGNDLFRIAAIVQQNGWDAETILRKVIREQEAIYREREKVNS
jgi:uncharacterized protein YabN with tetrapyrrole methylase and pyrophosphatase domain